MKKIIFVLVLVMLILFTTAEAIEATLKGRWLGTGAYSPDNGLVQTGICGILR